MADVLRQLLASGKLSDEDCHSILRGFGKQVNELHLSKTEHVDGWTSEEEEELDPEYCRQVNESLGFDIDGNVRIPACGISPVFLGERKPHSEVALYGRLGVHCFNMEKGRNLQYVHIPKYNITYPLARSYHITVEVKDLADNSAHIFQTLVKRTFSRNGEDFRVFTGICRLKPKTPGKGDVYAQLDEHAVDEFYRGCMPNFLSKAGTGDDKLRFYEVQEQDICENDWLSLYTEFALFCFWRYNEDGFKSCLPVEINKIVVETCETHIEPRLKLKSSNAIFHINFSAESRNYNSVVRRTTDGKTGHIVLQIKTWVDQPSSSA